MRTPRSHIFSTSQTILVQKNASLGWSKHPRSWILFSIQSFFFLKTRNVPAVAYVRDSPVSIFQLYSNLLGSTCTFCFGFCFCKKSCDRNGQRRQSTSCRWPKYVAHFQYIRCRVSLVMLKINETLIELLVENDRLADMVLRPWQDTYKKRKNTRKSFLLCSVMLGLCLR